MANVKKRTGPPLLEMLTTIRAQFPEAFAKTFGEDTTAEEATDRSTIPQAEPFFDAAAFPVGPDPDELLKDRFLCRGGGLLLVGPTGIGKSSLSSQAAASWALGRDFFGISPVRPLKILIIQAENNRGDIGEFRQGLSEGLNLTPADLQALSKSLWILQEQSRTGKAFAGLLDAALGAREYDLAIVDPAFSFLGDDASAQAAVSPWLRNHLNPVLDRRRVGLVLVHHSNKPPSGSAQKSTWQAGDFAYLGAGSAEWANWARAVLAIRNVGSPTVFELLAAKRGSRLGWTERDGGATVSKMLAHSKEAGRICWREAEAEEAKTEGGREDPVSEIIAAIVQIWQNDETANAGQNAGQVKNPLTGIPEGTVNAVLHNLMESKGISISTARRQMAVTEKKGFVRRSGGHGGCKSDRHLTGIPYMVHITDKARPLLESLYGL